MYQVYYLYLLFHVVPKYEESKTLWTIVFQENVLGIIMSCSLHGFIDCGSHLGYTRRDVFFSLVLNPNVLPHCFSNVCCRSVSLFIWVMKKFRIPTCVVAIILKKGFKKREELFLMIVIHFHFLSYCERIRVDKLSHFIVYPIL